MQEGPAVVVGGNRGLGLGIADHLAEVGHHVVVTWRSAPGPRHEGVRCDVTDAAQVDAAFAAIQDQHGTPSAVVVNAGTAAIDLLLRPHDAKFRDVLDTNLMGSLYAARAAGRMMARARRGSIVLISSVSALYGTGGLGAYAASKAGQIGLARTLARELGRRNVTVNVVAPGVMEHGIDLIRDPDAWLADTPLGRAGQLSELGAVVAFLASERARFITGAVVPVDGGFAMGMT